MAMQLNTALTPSSATDWSESSSSEATDPTRAEQLAAQANAQNRVLQQPAGFISAAQGSDVSAVARGASAGASAIGRQAYSALSAGTSSRPVMTYDTRAPTTKPAMRMAAATINSMNVNNMEAYRILEEASGKNYELDSKLSTAANKANFTAKQASIHDLQQQIHGERLSAGTQLAFSIGGAATTAGMSATANKLMNTAEKPNSMKGLQDKLQDKNLTLTEKEGAKERWAKDYKDAKFPESSSSATQGSSAKISSANTSADTSDESYNQFHSWRASKNNGSASPREDTIKDDLEEFLRSKAAKTAQSSPRLHGEIMQSSAAATGNVVNQTGTTIDTLGGGRYQADQAKIAQKEDDMQSTIAQQVVDASKSAKERDLKSFSDALDTVKQATQRWASVIDKIG